MDIDSFAALYLNPAAKELARKYRDGEALTGIEAMLLADALGVGFVPVIDQDGAEHIIPIK